MGRRTVADYLKKRVRYLWNGMINKYRRRLTQCKQHYLDQQPFTGTSSLLFFSPMTHVTDYENQMVGDYQCAVAVPTGVMALDALRKDPEKASLEEKMVAKFLLTIALPCIEKDLNNEPTWWVGRSTWRILGGHWYHSMALASVLMDHYSELENVMENNKPKDKGNSKTSPIEGPKQKKKRKHLVTKQVMETTITDLYYERTTTCLAFYEKADHYETLLELWDKGSGRRVQKLRKLPPTHPSNPAISKLESMSGNPLPMRSLSKGQRSWPEVCLQYREQ